MPLISFLSRLALVSLVVWLPLLSSSLHGQVVEKIEANPNAWTLRSIWKVTGVNSGDRVGSAVGQFVYIDEDPYMDFIVHFGKESTWRAYRGNAPRPDTVPFWEAVISAPLPSYPVIGNFEGNESRYFVSGHYRFQDDPDRYLLYFYRIASGSVEESPGKILNALETMEPPVLIAPTDIRAVDLDGEEGDELVLSTGMTLRENVRSQVGEIWFYQGGESFQVDQPTHVIVVQEENFTENQYYLYTQDFDGDQYLDVALGTQYRDGNYKLKFWFGRDGSPWNWTNQPDRVLLLGPTGLNHELTIGDYDGDGTVDLAGTVYDGDLRHIHLYLSRSGKDFRTRSFAREDAEKVLTTTLLRTRTRVGYVGDSSQRYEMLSLTGPSIYHANEPMIVLFSGGKLGPNNTWDAYYSPSSDGVTSGGVLKFVEPVSDVDGNGWDDFLMSDDRWFGFDHGIALVIGGGPEIPNDDTTLSVRAIGTEEHNAALHIWPNPVVEELNIAWRGDLRRMPHRFAVYDELGRLVAEGSVEPGVGAAIWRCGNILPGTYLLSMFDGNEGVIASTTITKVNR